MAKRSAYYTVEKHRGPVTTRDVMQEQGLCEIRAKKALEDLVAEGKLFKVDGLYYTKRPVPHPTDQ